MKKNFLLSLLGLLFWCGVSWGQSIQNSVVASTGASASAGNVKMDYTLGEIVVETFSAGGNTLTQGFHQTNLTLVAIENAELFPSVNIYPNPASDIVNIAIPAENSFDIYMYDAAGKLINAWSKATGVMQIDVQQIASGTYYLQMADPAGNNYKTFKLVKNQ